MKQVTLFIIAALFCCGCYRMPEEGEVSTVPTVNNPKYSGKNKQGALLPSFDY